MQGYVGQKFGKLVLIEYLKYDNWLCKCECGNKKIIKYSNMKRGATKSCGCLKKKIDYTKSKNYKHGMRNTRMYAIWKEMKRRCLRPTANQYKDYGGRGIKVCEEWQKDFMNFYNWAINNGYNDNLTIDRIDVNGNYEPNNCRWATRKQQNNNTTRSHYITYKNKTQTIKDWSEEFNIPYKRLEYAVNRGKQPINEYLQEKEKIKNEIWRRNRKYEKTGKRY